MTPTLRDLPTTTHRIVLDGDERSFLDFRDGSGGTIEILDIVVESGSRRKGKGRRMVSILMKCVDPATKVWAITRADNAIGQEFYESLHFRVVGVLREFYGNGNCVDALVYGRLAGGAV